MLNVVQCSGRFSMASKLLILERETGLEPATSSLGRRQQIGNKEHCVSGHLVLAIEITRFSLWAFARLLTEHKRSTRVDLVQDSPIATGTSLRLLISVPFLIGVSTAVDSPFTTFQTIRIFPALNTQLEER